MKILALIPARGGSKRLPGKNIKQLGNKPLIAWTIETARKSTVCEHVWVSTDDLSIAKVSQEWGAEVPFMRPPELATDEASSIDVALHALAEYERLYDTPDALLLLQPTSPFRPCGAIKQAVELLSSNKSTESIVSVNSAVSHPAWCFHFKNGWLEPFLDWKSVNSRSQDLEPAWILNGLIYLIRPNSLKENKSFLSDKTIPLIIDNKFAIDIDTPSDWDKAVGLLDSNFGFSAESR